MSFETSFQHLLKWEGGYGNNPHDAGGATNLGVIQEEYDKYRDRKELPRQSVRYISKTEACEIYKEEYWDATSCDKLNRGVANCLFDAAVNSGVKRGIQWLQEAINNICKQEVVKVDKICGPITISAANGLAASQLIDEMLRIRLAFMHVARNSKTGEALWPVFGGGWQKRIDGVRAQSHALCGVAVAQEPLLQSPAKISKKAEKPMSDLSPVLNLAKVIAPAVATALEKSNPLFGIAIGILSNALETTAEALPSTASSVDASKLASAIQTTDAQLKAHAKAAAEITAQPAPAAPGPADSSSIYVDPVASIVQYVLSAVGVALMVRMGMTVDMANGIMANIIPTIWTALAGAMALGMGWLQHRSVVGSNAATAAFVKKA